MYGINSQVEHVVRNGDVDGYPGCINLSFSYVEGESLLMALKASTSVFLGCLRSYTLLRISRCRPVVPVLQHRWNHPTYSVRLVRTLKATDKFSTDVGICSGAAEDMAHSSLRFGIGRFTTEAEIDFVVSRIVRVVNRLRDMRSAVYVVCIGFC